MMQIDVDKMYSMREVADLCEVDVSTPWRWIGAGVKGQRLGSALVGGRRRVTGRALVKFFADINARHSDAHEATRAIDQRRLSATEQELDRRLA